MSRDANIRCNEYKYSMLASLISATLALACTTSSVLAETTSTVVVNGSTTTGVYDLNENGQTDIHVSDEDGLQLRGNASVTGNDVNVLVEGTSSLVSALDISENSAVNISNFTFTSESADGVYAESNSTLNLNTGTIVTHNNEALYGKTGSKISLKDTHVVSDGVSGDVGIIGTDSTLDISGQATNIELTEGQLHVSQGAALTFSDGKITTTGTDSSVLVKDSNTTGAIKNATINHNNASGAGLTVSNSALASLTDGAQVNSSGVGIEVNNATLSINNATITAAGDGITLDGTANLDATNTIVSSDTIALNVQNYAAGQKLNITGGEYTAPVALQIGASGLAVNATGTKINGDINITSNASVELIEGSILNGAVHSEGGALALESASQWNISGDSSVSSLTNNGILNFESQDGKYSTLNADILILQNDSQLKIGAGDLTQPLITGTAIKLNGNLAFTGEALPNYTSDTQFGYVTLIDAESDINTNFASIRIRNALPDYLTVTGGTDAADATKYNLGFNLSWNAGQTGGVSSRLANGTFTLDAGDSFEVTEALNDVTSNNHDWDGKTLNKAGEGTLLLSGDSLYSGSTSVDAGTLWLTGTIGAAGSQQAVNVAQNAIFGGSGTVNGNIDNQGVLIFGNKPSQLQSAASGSLFTVNGDLINAGDMVSAGSTPGNTLMVNGNYIGNGGSLTLNTHLGDDSSATDMLVVTGNTSGDTTLYINNVGGAGAQTDRGIEVVSVGGDSQGTFTQGSQVQINAWEYRLYQDEGDWYLRTQAEDTGDEGTSGDDGTSGNDDVVTPQYRADIGAYLGNQWMVRQLQMQTLYDREGSQLHSGDNSMWARFKAGRSESTAADDNVEMTSNYSQFQFGGDIAAFNDGEQSLAVGVMASYVNAQTDSDGNRGADGSQFSASGSVDGYNVGMYATWFADQKDHRGLYVDSWYQYGIYSNSVEDGDLGSSDYDSTANAISVETGYRYDIALRNGNSVSLTPQAQVVWQDYSADTVKDHSGTTISGQDSQSWTSRLGLRLDSKLHKDNGVVQPFAEVNWLHSSDDMAATFGDAEVKQDIPENRAELKAGIQVNVNDRWSITGAASGQTGSNDYSDLNGNLNIHYRW